MSEYLWNLLMLYFTFFKIGVFTIGGGMAMIPLINKEVVEVWPHLGQGMHDLIGIAEIVPGPFAINAATFAGTMVAGVGGAIFATLGVITPSMIITTVVARFFYSLREKRGIKRAFYAMRPAVVGLIAGTVLLTIPQQLISLPSFTIDIRSMGIFIFSLYCMLKWKISPEITIFFAAALGLLFALPALL